MQDWQWIQLNVGLVRQHQQALSSARKLFEVVGPLTQLWRETGQLQWFFFMRKPPDVRLRFYTCEPELVRSQLTGLMDELHRQNIISQNFFSKYEPECDRFGGSPAMEWVHAYFDGDTAQWWCLDQLKQQSKPLISEVILLPAILQNLFESTLLEPKKVLMVWQNLGKLFEVESQQSEPSLNLTLIPIQELRQSVEINTEMGQVLNGYLRVNAEVSRQLKHLSRGGQIEGDLLNILANIGQFTLHRHGLDWQRASPLIEGVIDCLKLRSPFINPLS
jgi:thiopeptide-type bacteriocin biosynthesis protein